jgi:hypothetical protein
MAAPASSVIRRLGKPQSGKSTPGNQKNGVYWQENGIKHYTERHSQAQKKADLRR